MIKRLATSPHGVVVAATCGLALLAGCGSSVEDSSAQSDSGSVTLGPQVAPDESASAQVTEKTTGSAIVTTSHESSPTSQPLAEASPSATATTSENNTDEPTANPAVVSSDVQSPAVAESRTFKVEGPGQALRVSFDDVDLLKVMNLDPVPSDAPERLPAWLKALDGKRIRVRGFMFPPFQESNIRGFVLARDNQICCFGRTPKEYDLIDIFMRKEVTTHYIQNRPFDVVGVFRIKSEIEKYSAMYEMEDAVVIEN